LAIICYTVSSNSVKEGSQGGLYNYGEMVITGGNIMLP
jgi:hypothetical protein